MRTRRVYAVGKDASVSVKTIRFPVRVGFHARVKPRVYQYFADHRLAKTGDWRLFLKTGIILLWFVLFYVLYVFCVTSLLMALLTVVDLAQGFILIGFNLTHNGGHHSYSRQKTINWLMGFIFIRQTCDEFAIPYVCYPTVWAAIEGHYRLLKTLGRRRMSPPNLIGGTVP
jgi:hypothetical protein